MKIGILISEIQRFGPKQTCFPLLRFEMILHELRLSLSVDKTEGVNSETVNMAIRARNAVSWPYSAITHINVCNDEGSD